MNLKYFFTFLLLVALTVWLAVLFYPEEKLKIIACDVGQGDSVLIEYKTNQILIDGGNDSESVISCLSRYMPFWDRKIEIVVVTHPQKDHYGGLIEVFSRYKSDLVIVSGLDSSNRDWEVLKNIVGGQGVQVVNARQGQSIRFGMIYLDILWPNEEFIKENIDLEKEKEKILSSESLAYNLKADFQDSDKKILGTFVSKSNPNDFSVVLNLRFGEFDALMTGDIESEISEILANYIGRTYQKDFEYIKVPHHGSRNGMAENLLEETTPEVAVVSVGESNRFGHPSKEVISMLKDNNIRVYRTDEVGDIEIITDGKRWWMK